MVDQKGSAYPPLHGGVSETPASASSSSSSPPSSSSTSAASSSSSASGNDKKVSEISITTITSKKHQREGQELSSSSSTSSITSRTDSNSKSRKKPSLEENEKFGKFSRNSRNETSRRKPQKANQEDLHQFDHHHHQVCLKHEPIKFVTSQDDIPGGQEPGTWLGKPVTCRRFSSASTSSGVGESLLAGGVSFGARKGFRGSAGGSARGRGDEATATITARGHTHARLPRSTFCAASTHVKTTSPGTVGLDCASQLEASARKQEGNTGLGLGYTENRTSFSKGNISNPKQPRL